MNHISYKSISSSASILQVLGILTQPKKSMAMYTARVTLDLKLNSGIMI